MEKRSFTLREGGKSSDLTQERHVCDAKISKVVHLREGRHCLLR